MRKERKTFDLEKHKPKTYLELIFPLGEFLQLDHGEAEVHYLGQIKIGYLFTASVPGYCLRYCQFYLTKGSESWGDFHERSFVFFGGIF